MYYAVAIAAYFKRSYSGASQEIVAQDYFEPDEGGGGDGYDYINKTALFEKGADFLVKQGALLASGAFTISCAVTYRSRGVRWLH